MRHSSSLTGFELLVMLATLKFGRKAYAYLIRKEIERCQGERVTPGHMHGALARLERVGFMRTRKGVIEDSPLNRPKRFVGMTPAGLAALDESLRALDAMREGILGFEPQQQKKKEGE
jgi:DNA-binding PadR family transcriptional regulator